VSLNDFSRLVAGNPYADDYRRTTVGDTEGRFEFSGLPPGDYYLTYSITWSVRSPVGNCRGDALTPYHQKGICPFCTDVWREQSGSLKAHKRSILSVCIAIVHGNLPGQ
jgi:hypothetical protein